MKDVLLRCGSCGAANRISTEKLKSHPKCGKCHSEISFPDRPLDISSSAFQSEVIRAPGIVLLEFWSPGCVHCRKLNPLMDQAASEFAGIVKIVKINIQADQHLATQFGIQGVPSLFLYKGGKRIGNIKGALDKAQLTGWIRSTAGI